MQKENGLKEGEEKRNKKTEKKNGRKESKIEMAKKLLEMNLTVEQIIEVTELSKEEIKKLKNNFKLKNIAQNYFLC